MIRQLLYTLLFIVVFLFLIFICEILYRKFKLKAETTRKLAHIAAALFSLVFLYTFQSYAYVVILGVIFFLLLFIGKRYQFFISIESVQRKTSGSFLLPLSICSLFVISKISENQLFFVLPILVLSLSDPLASIAGTTFKGRTKNIYIFRQKLDKTYLGSIVFAVSTMSISVVVLYLYNFSGFPLIGLSVIITLTATVVEMLSYNGYDNLTVPHVILLLLYLTSIF